MPLAGIGDDRFAIETKTLHVPFQAGETRLGSIHGNNVGARDGELRGFAAGCRAKIRDFETGDLSEQLGGKGSGRVLHPPRTFVIAGERGNRPMRGDAHRTGRQ